MGLIVSNKDSRVKIPIYKLLQSFYSRSVFDFDFYIALVYL